MSNAAIKDLIKAQQEMGKAIRNSDNPFHKSKYANLETVLDATMKPFQDNNFAVLQRSDKDDDGHYVETVLLHTSGETFTSKLYLVLAKNDMQGLGSAITYARRYSLQGMAGIAPEDDDGEAASGRTNAKPQKQSKPPKKAPQQKAGEEPSVEQVLDTLDPKLKSELNRWHKGFGFTENPVGMDEAIEQWRRWSQDPKRVKAIPQTIVDWMNERIDERKVEVGI